MKSHKRFPFAPGAVEHGTRKELFNDLVAAILLMAASGLIGFALGLMKGCTP